MGGRGSKLYFTTNPTVVPASPKVQIQQQPIPVAQQPPNDTNTPVQPNALTALSSMSDAQLAQLFTSSQQVSMPNHLSDVDDITQKFVYAAGLNEKPQVLDAAEFSKFMSDNNIPQSQIISRSINGGTLQSSAGRITQLSAQQVADMAMYSKLNYVGGKHGGQAYGAGTYFDMNGGGNTGYGGKTLTAVLNPKTARVISLSDLRSKAAAFDRANPAFRRATGGFSMGFHNNNMSVYALAMGYNVIRSGSAGSGYHNVIDRSALVYKK